MDGGDRTHFAHPGNRFYPALRRAASSTSTIDRGAGMTDDDRADLIGRGIGITNLVARATARASELSARRAAAGGGRLVAFVAEHQPVVVAVAGVTAYRDAFGGRDAAAGRQPEIVRRAPCCGSCPTRAGSTPTRRSTPWPPPTGRPRSTAGIVAADD